MAPNPNRRRRTKSIVRSDNFVAWAVPTVMMGVAIYQVVTTGKVDKLIIGVLLIYGLAASGWRIDVFFDTYMKAKYGKLRDEEPPPQMPARSKADDNKDDDGDTG